MNSLSTLKAPEGSRHRKKRVGRGQGSGWGKTAGRGGKGQKARTGNMHFEGFEGGQMPLQRRLPKYGFHNPFRRELAIVNLGTLEERFEAGEAVDADTLEAKGVLSARLDGLKILGNGELTKALKVRADRVSATAKAAIEKAGGSVELIAEKVVKVGKRGTGVRARIANERATRRAAAKNTKK